MIVTALIWVYILVVSSLFGRLTERLVFGGTAADGSAALRGLIGLATISGVAAWISLFRPVDGWTHVGVAGIAVVWGIGDWRWIRDHLQDSIRRARAAHPLVLLFVLIALLVTLERATARPAHTDTASYHAQAIRWLEEYGAVPGLANLHHRLGFGDAWFVGNAVFSFAWMGGRSYHVLGGFAFAMLLVFCGGRLQRLVEGERDAGAWVATGVALLLFPALDQWFSTPAPDIPVSVLTAIVLTLLVDRADRSHGGGVGPLAWLASFAVMIKLSALPLILAPVVTVVGRARGMAWLRVAGGVALLVVIPFVARTVISTGWLIFPSETIDVFDVDWRVPEDRVIEARRQVIETGRQIPSASVGERDARPANWFPRWGRRLHWLESVSLIAGLAVPVLLGFAAFVRRRSEEVARWLPVFVVCWSGLVFWLLTAPHTRFAWGLIFGTATIAGVLLMRGFLERIPVPLVLALLIAIIAAKGVKLYTVEGVGSDLGERLVQPADYEDWETTPHRFDGFEVQRSVVGKRCGYEPFPCTPETDQGIELRGDSFASGFRRAE